MPSTVSVPFLDDSIVTKRVKTADRRHLIGNAKNISTANIEHYEYSDIIAILEFGFDVLEESNVIKAQKKAEALRQLAEAAKDKDKNKIYSFKTTHYDWLLLLQRRALSLQRADRNRRNL
jgi:hypothetical protein